MRTRLTMAVASAVALVAVGCGSDASDAGVGEVRSDDHLVANPPTTGQYIADSGFRPNPDGFSFANYGDEVETVGMGTAQVVDLFGEEACESTSGGVCRLSSPAATWLQMVNSMAAGGHCEGLAVQSQLFALGVESPTSYGADTTFALPLEGNEPLQRRIAQWFSTQATEPAQRSSESGASPTEVLDTLIADLSPEQTAENNYTLAIFKPEFLGGHALTPYAVEDRGDGIFWIMVYDNNYPDESRAVAVDRQNNSWSYLGSDSADEPEAVYAGDAGSPTLTLTPTAPRLVTQDCPFCAADADEEAQADVTNQFSLTGAGSLAVGTDFYVTDVVDQRLGRSDGALVSDIPDGRVVPLAMGRDVAPAPLLEVPSLLDTTVTIASQLESTSMEFAMIGAGYDVFIEGINAPAGSPATVKLGASGERIDYTSGPKEGPYISAATGNEAGYTFDFDVDAIEFEAENAKLTIASPDGSADVVVGSKTAGRYQIFFNAYAPDDSERQFEIPEFNLAAGERLILAFENWDGEQEPVADVLDDEGEVTRSLTITETTLAVPRVL